MKTHHPLLLATWFLAATPALPAQAPPPPPPAPSPLPIREVTLFTSGVAYTERGGIVDGDATIPLLFRTAQINDILKSLILLDEKGQVRPATYAARDPIGRTLGAFAVDVSQPTGRAELLNRLRGTPVVVEAGGIVIAASTMTTKETLTGRIVGVETKTETTRDGRTITIEVLTVLGDPGLQSVRLDEVKTIRLLDERLNREFQTALGLLASGSDDQRRQVTLHFAGTGRRDVRVGYVTEAPLWKMSYRLVLGGKETDKSAGKPYLQGWALVENTTDEDWQNVRLALVSGRPISFLQDLYQPLYLPRPVVAPDIVASPYPQTHGGDLQDRRDAAAKPESAAQTEAELKRVRIGGAAGLQRSNRRAGEIPAETATAPAPASPGGGAFGGGMRTPALDVDTVTLVRQSVAAQAQGQEAGELFSYNITTPVTLPRQQAAMIPVVAQDIGGDKVSLYNADTGPRFPLNAVRVRNTTSLHLKGGPVTLFDDGVYAGDAKMEDIPPGDSRLVSYAVDLSVEGERQGPAQSTTETSLSLKRGVLIVTRREKLVTTYTLKSKSDRARTVLVEHPFRTAYKLLAPEKATERTAGLYRFAIAVPPGKSATLKVAEERPISQTIAVLDSDLNLLGVYANRRDISPRLRETLQEIVRRRRRVDELQQQANNRQAEIDAIERDQERIRKNMTALDKSAALYKRYVNQLDQQETRIQSHRTDASRLRAQAAEADRALRGFVDRLNIDE